MSKPPVYEQPLNERIRGFMRFQYLFTRLDHHLSRSAGWDTQAALSTFLEIVNLSTRTDLKSEVMKELERQHNALEHYANAPEVDVRRLGAVMARQKELIDRLDQQKGQISLQAASNEFLNSVRQRASVSGSTCSMDLPVYQFWLSTPIEQRRATINDWVAPMEPVRAAVALVLEAIRKSAPFTATVADNGFYQQTIPSARTLQLVNVTFKQTCDLFPEISAGKHRFTIRFLEQTSTQRRAEQTTRDVTFLLACCAI